MLILPYLLGRIPTPEDSKLYFVALPFYAGSHRVFRVSVGIARKKSLRSSDLFLEWSGPGERTGYLSTASALRRLKRFIGRFGDWVKERTDERD
jgi:hypothetical protein